MSSQAVMKRQILALAKREPSNEELQKIKQSLAVYKTLTKEEQSKINEMVKDAHAKLESEGKFAKGGTTKTQSLKTALTDLKNKVGVKKFKRATSGTDIKKDIGIPAQKVGKRIVRKKGKTSNQYGTFKNQVGTTYYESRSNRSDVNQPSEKRKIKLADGGQFSDFNPKSFTLGDLQEMFRNKDIELHYLRKGDVTTNAASRDMLWKSGDKITKFADWKLTISDYGQLFMDKGDENLYLALIVYKDNESQPMELQIYTKDNHQGLKDFSQQIIKKFAKGGEIENSPRMQEIINRRVEISDYINKKYGQSRGKNKAEKQELEALGKEYRMLGYEYNMIKDGEFAKGGSISKGVEQPLFEEGILISKPFYVEEKGFIGLSKSYNVTNKWDENVTASFIISKNLGITKKDALDKANAFYDFCKKAKTWKEYEDLSSEFIKEWNAKEKYAQGGEVSQYIDGLSKQEVLSKTIVYDNGGESYDRYTIFTPDGSVYGMSETAEGFNQYIGDSSEIEKGKHLGKKLRSVPKGIQGAVLDRMLDDEQMFAKGGKISKEDALEKAIEMGVDFNKDFHAQSVGNELAELAKESGYKKSPSSSGSTGRAFFNHLKKIYDAKVLANHKQTMRNAPFDENTYPKGTEFADGGKLRSKAKYIPNRNIDEIEVTRNGKTTSIDGANLLDGVYVKKGTKFAKGGEIGQKVFEAKEDGILGIFSGSDSYSIQISKGDTFVTYGDQDNSNWWYVKKIDKKPSTMSLNNDFDYTKSKSRVKVNWDELILTFPKGDNMIYAQMQEIYAKGGTIKKSLAEFKNKVGASKYREATRGVDIKADLKIPALKKGRRVVTTKGKTSNQYGIFKNKVGSVYYENRPNHYDVNQPSEKRKIKLAKGGEMDKYNPEKTLSLVKVKFSNPKFNYTTNLSGDISEKEAKNYFVGQKFDVGVYPKENMQQVIDIDFYPKGTWSFDKQYAQGGTFADGGVLEGAKIYVADLAEYNNGRLVGKWFDFSDYSDASELMVAIQEMLDEQTAKDKYGEVHEEWAVHDFEGFPRNFYSEYMGEKDFEKLYQIAEVANDRGLPIDVLMEAVADFGADEDEIERIAEAYYSSVRPSYGGEWRSFAMDMVDEIGIEGINNAEYYFDYDSFGSDARTDYTDEELEEYGYDELDDTELGERLVDDMGGFDQLGKETIEGYFDYDKFGDALEYDFISVKGDDGDYYFFNRNW